MATPELNKPRLTATAMWQSVACWGMLGASFLLLYASTLRGLLEDWRTDPDYSHGMIVPFVAAYIVFRRREIVKSLPLEPKTLLGWGVIVASQLVFLAGYFGAEFFLQRSSIVAFLAGMILLLAGWNHLRRWR